ncbi:hypothetical protein MKX08_000308 [Trichoderma sp. CBMAI-0020]|nr:hypothetical protein MKX08_000308 [Trichoderma sp. CBMAI-0020]
MSTVKFQSPSYRLFEPGYLPIPIKPIIVDVDDEFGSPETLTLRYEEAVQAAQRGDPSRDSPPSDFDMAAYSKAQLPPVNGYDAASFADPAYEPYPTPGFSQAEKYAQYNQNSFTSNSNAVAQYMAPRPTLVTLHPPSGVFGTKVHFKIHSQEDLFSPQAFVLFGSAKCPADLIRDSQDSSGYVFSCSIDAPQPLVTGSNTSVPVSFVIEGPAGGEISRTGAGTFHYLEGSEDDITRADKMPKDGSTAPAPEIDQASPSPKAEAPPSAATNTYEYPQQQGQYANTFPQANNEMLSAYRTASFSDSHYNQPQRRAHSAWSGYGNPMASAGRNSSTYDHPPISSRPNLPQHPPISSSGSNGAPQLVRTSTLTAGAGGGFHPMYTSKAVLKINGNLNDMAAKWTEEEWSNRRRIVQFKKSQHQASLHVSFKAVPVNERPPNSICISCIWWQEKSDCYVTSVDTIHLLEQLVAAPNRFSVEEKNRIRRNLEGFHPVTVSKAKTDSEEFFKIIMAFPHPKPRNIEKDVKVFPWSTLEPALKKIIGKYSASPSSMMNPVSTPSYGAPPAGHHGIGSQHGISSQHADSHGQFSMHSGYNSSHHETMPLPRQASWASTGTYSTSVGRGLSPSGLRSHHSPPQSSLRINTSTAQLPAVSAYDARTVASPYASAGLHTPLSHHAAAATPPRWETAPSAYTDSGYPALTSHQASGAQSVYAAAAAYNDGPPRA